MEPESRGPWSAWAMLDEKASYGISDQDPKSAALRDLALLLQQAGVQAVLIDGLAVCANGHVRTTADVDILVPRADAVRLRDVADGGERFQSRGVNCLRHVGTGVKVDVCVEGDRTRPRGPWTFPHPASLATLDLKPIRPVALADLVLLKILSHRAKDDADVIELLKRGGVSEEEVARQLPDAATRALFQELIARAREERQWERTRE